MEKSPHSKLYEPVLRRLKAMRRAAGLTTRGLADRLRAPNSLITRAELGERRVDLLELYRFCTACGEAPEKVAAALMREIAAVENEQRAASAPALGKKGRSKRRKPSAR